MNKFPTASKLLLYAVTASLLPITTLMGGTYYNAKQHNKEVAIGKELLEAVLMPSEEEVPSDQLSIIENVSKNETLSTLAKALQAADLANVLKGNGPFTLFAPTDQAFEKLPPGTLQNLLKPENKTKLAAILTYHIVPGRKSSGTLKSGTLKTLSGKELTITIDKKEITVNGTKVILPEIIGMNGTIYIIDQVILQ